MRAIELLGEESPRARFFAVSRRLVFEVLRGNLAAAPHAIEQTAAAAEEAVIPDVDPILHGMRGYTAFFSGDTDTCAQMAAVCESVAVEHGVASLRAEAAFLWLGGARPDKVAEMIAAFTPPVLADLPRDSDWLLTLQCVLEGAIAVGASEIAAPVVELLTPYAGRSVVNAGAVMWHGVTDDTLARAQLLLGDRESAERHRIAALATYDRIGASWWRDRLRDVDVVVGAAAGPTDDRVVHLHEEPGGLWTVGRAGATFVLPGMRGLAHLRALLAQPGRELSALELAGGSGVVLQGGIDVLDDEAVSAYRARLAVIDELLEDAADSTADELIGERDALLAELGHATGLGGRGRRTGASDERARVAVRKAIVAALARLAEQDPWLGRHLHDHVRTGSRCRYDPDPDQPVRWVLG
jgi:hypothetical protein